MKFKTEDELEQKKHRRTSIWVYIFGWAGGIFTVLGIASPFIIHGKYLKKSVTDAVYLDNTVAVEVSSPYTTLSDLGPIGDYLGGSSTPFFTLASFFILVAALIAQMLELRATRQEFSKQNETFTEQNKLIAIQRFESTFFQMVSLYNEVVNSISGMDNINREVFGRDQLGLIQEKFEEGWIAKIAKEHFKKSYTTGEKDKLVSNKIELNSSFVYNNYIDFYDYFYNGDKNKAGNEQIIGHYLRSLYNILRWVHFSQAIQTYEEKMDYVRIIRAQLSTQELKIIYFNCMYSKGYKMKALADKYDLFDNLDTTTLKITAINEVYKNIKDFDPTYTEKVADLNIS